MTVFEITAPDGRVLEIEGEKAPSETDLDEIFKTIPIKTNPVSDNQAALENIKSADTDDVGMTLTEKFNKLRQDAAKYAKNIPEKQNGMSWLEYAKLRKKYDEDWNLQTPELNPLKAMWKNSVIGMMSENLYRGQKDRRAMQYTDNKEVLTEIPAKAQSDWKEKGQIKAGEALMRSDWSRVIPFAGSMSGLNESFDIKSIIDKKNKGEELSKKEVERLNGYILDVAEQNQRGISFGGKLIQGALELPSFAGEFMATGGIATLGKQAVQKTVTKGLQNAAQKEIGKRLTAGLIEGAAGAVTRTSIGMPQRVVENYGMRRLHESLGITDKGQVLLETADEKPYSTFLKAWGDTVIENWSEEMGGGIAEAAGLSLKGAGKLVSPLQEKLFSRNTRAAFIKAIRKLRPNATVKDIMTRAGFNGILGEMGEERAGDVLRVMFGIDDRQDVSTFEKICEAINPGAEELLLELGLFSIPGSMSFVASKVANHLRAKNISEEDISDYMRLSSELEKESLLSNIAQNNDLAITENFESNLRDIKNHYFTQNLNAGLEKTEALATAEIEANAAAIMSKQYGISLDEAKDRLALNVQSLTDEQAAEQMQADTKVLQGGIEMEVEKNPASFQSAMYKSPMVNFEDFYNQVFEKENSKSKSKKSYFDFNNGNVSVRIPHDTIVHDENKHKMSANEWEEILNNLDKPSDAVVSSKPRFDGQPILLKIIGENQAYGAVVEFFENKQPIITTAFADEETNIDKWLNKNRSAQAKNTSSVTTKGMLLSQDHNTIMTYLKENFKPVAKTYYQTIKNETIPSGTKTSFLGTRLNNIIRYVQPKFKPFVPKTYFQSAYHGTPHKFDEFSLDNIGTGEGAQAHGWGLYFAENKDVSENYREKLTYGQFDKIFYKDKEIKDSGKAKYFKAIYETPFGGKKFIAEQINENIAEIQKRIDRYKEGLKTETEQYQIDTYKGAIKNLENEILDFKKDIEFYNSVNPDDIRMEHNKGQLFEVDIPDSDVLLDEDKSFSEQSDFIKNALKELDEKEDLGLMQYEIESYTTGKEIYERIGKLISTRPQRAEKTSKLLNQYGIKGITYDGQQDGRCYVIFDDKAINVLKTYYQGMDDNIDSNIQNARGFTYRRFNFDGTVKDNLIVLLKNKSDKSTLLHEFAHVYLTTLNDLARDNAKAKADLLVVNKWLGYNGVEYTDFQHEKFANGFVAYVKTGKAPTYGLKKAFEQFKRWLNELYNELVYSDEIELDNDAKAVFDELLGGKSQEAVAEQIKDFVKKAENNALLRLRAEKVEKRELPQNMLTEYQRKYCDTAYDIIWYALSHIKKKEGGFEEPLVKDKRQLYMLFGNDSKVSSKNKGIMKQAEKLEFVLGEVDDVFSGNDGFLSEWGEFFNDPGIGQNEGADTTLALTALDVIKQRKYLYETEKAFEGISEEDIKRAQYELDYILDEFKNNSDRDLVVAGFFDWIENQPEFLQEDFITKWENSTNEIERYEALTKFEQAKEDLKLYAAALKGFGDYSWQFAEYARKILKRLDFMTEHDKAKIFDKLKDFNSFREIERNLDDVMDYAETLNDVSLRRNLADTIVNEVKRTTPIIKNGTKKTRYDYRTNKLFERLRYLNKLKQEEIQDLYDAYVNGEIERRASQFDENGTITGKTESYFEDIENSFLQFKANGMYYNSTELLQTLLSKIQNAKFTGKIARDEMDFEQRMNQENWINSCAQAIETHRGKSGKIEEIYSMEANFDSMLSMVFDDDIKNQFSLDDLYAQVDGRVGKDREEILNKIAEIFGFSGALKGAMLNNKFIEMANEKFTIKQRYANKERWGWEPVTLSKMEVLYYYIQAKNPVSYSMLTDMGDETHSAKGQFDKFEFDELLKNLSDQEKLMGDALQIAAEKYYNDLNKYHIKKHHIDLGKATCYFPRKSELKEINELDLFNQYTEKSTNPKFVKMRSAGPSIRIAPANPVNVLFNHIQKANTIIIMGDKLDLMNKVFRDNDLGQKIKSVFGDTVYKEFMQHVTENLYDGQAKALSNAEGIISKLMSNIIGVPMFIKPQVGLKQVLGLINYGVGDEYVGTLEWMKAFTNVIKNPKSAIDFMMQDEYLKDRLTRGNMNEAMKNQIDNKLSSKLSLLTDYFSLNMRYGDLFNLTLGGKAYIDVLMSKGYTKTQAFELFRKKTISDQQSSIASTLSNLQRNSKNNPFARLLFAYQNTPHQYFRICANAIIKAKRGRMSKSQAVKTVFIYWWFLPFIFNMAGSLSPITLIATGDPDELINDMLIACLGSISCIPFFGEMARALFAGVTGSEYFGNKDWFTRANEAIVRPINKFRKGNLRFEDILKSLEIFAQGVGIPLEEIDTQLEAFGDYANGDFGKGVIKTLGYSRYRADAVTGDK